MDKISNLKNQVPSAKDIVVIIHAHPILCFLQLSLEFFFHNPTQQLFNDTYLFF